MKYIVLVPDGAADNPHQELNGKTPLEVAATPNMDRLAREGLVGLVQIIPPERHPGSDVGNLEIFGYDSCTNYTGRAALEAASMGVDLDEDDVAFRLNTITRDGDTLVDYSAGHISTEESCKLIKSLSEKLGCSEVRFYAGVGYRHLVVIRNGPDALNTVPPHDIMGKSIKDNLPTGNDYEKIREIMVQAEPIMVGSCVNSDRIARGESPANAIWLWGSGRALDLVPLEEKFGFSGGVISAVDLVRGIGSSAGLRMVDVPGITGYLDTNYEGKAQYALNVLREENFVYIHIEAPDEAGHNGDLEAKVQAIADIDKRVVGPLLEGLEELGPCRLLLTPDHRTPIELRTHSRDPVPFVLWGEGFKQDNVDNYSENSAMNGGVLVDRGYYLIEYLRGIRPIDFPGG